jgi:hypothetical protein
MWEVTTLYDPYLSLIYLIGWLKLNQVRLYFIKMSFYTEERNLSLNFIYCNQKKLSEISLR